jgi:hypothetical protein
MLFQPFNPSFIGWLVSNLEFCFLSLPWSLSFGWTKLDLSFDAISVD